MIDLERFRKEFATRLESSGAKVSLIAEASDVGPSTVWHWKQEGHSLPNIFQIKQIAERFDLSVCHLAFGIGPPERQHAEGAHKIADLLRSSPELESLFSTLAAMPPDRRIGLLQALGVQPSSKPVLQATKSVVPMDRRRELEVFPLRKGTRRKGTPAWMDLAAGAGGYLMRCKEVWVIPKLSMSRGIHTAVIRGDSMRETLQPGDVAILQELNGGEGWRLPPVNGEDGFQPLAIWKQRVPDDQIYALSLDGGLTQTIKRVSYQQNGSTWFMIVQADNPSEFKTYVVNPNDDVIVYAILLGLGEA